MFSNFNSLHPFSLKKLKGSKEHMMSLFLESFVQGLDLAFLEADLPIPLLVNFFVLALI
jgi:hypothetical protein